MDKKIEEAVAQLGQVFKDVLSNESVAEQELRSDKQVFLSQADVEKIISEKNADIIEKDAKSKFTFRKRTLQALFWLLGFQILFMNLLLAWLLVSQTVNRPFFITLSDTQTIHFMELAKWYTTAVLVELLGAFLYVVKVVFETPSFAKMFSKKQKK